MSDDILVKQDGPILRITLTGPTKAMPRPTRWRSY